MAKRKDGVSVTLSEIASLVKGELRGDGAVRVAGLSSSNESRSDHLSFLRETQAGRLQMFIETTKSAGLLVSRKAIAAVTLPADRNVILVDDPLHALIDLVPVFFEPDSQSGSIHPTAVLDPTASVGEGATVGAYVVIGAGVAIGKNTIIHPHVVLYPRVRIGAKCEIHANVTVREDVVIGDECTVQPGAVIGSDGFGYHLAPGQGLRTVPQVGTVELGARVDVGANACIDRATLGVTSIGFGSKLDNLVQIGHNVRIGNHSVVCGGSALAGSSVIGSGVTLAGQSGVADGVHIADGIRVGAKAGVIGDLREKGDYVGMPAIKARDWRRQQAALRHLPEMVAKRSGSGSEE